MERLNINLIKKALFIFLPLGFVCMFLFMTFFNSEYESPGRILYFSECASCHGDHGEGIRNLVPPIRSDYFEANFNKLPCMILNGLSDSILVNGVWYNQPMYPIKLSEVELSNLMNFLRDTFLNPRNNPELINSQWIDSKIKVCK
jgi:hypothetical protein